MARMISDAADNESVYAECYCGCSILHFYKYLSTPRANTVLTVYSNNVYNMFLETNDLVALIKYLRKATTSYLNVLGLNESKHTSVKLLDLGTIVCGHDDSTCAINITVDNTGFVSLIALDGKWDIMLHRRQAAELAEALTAFLDTKVIIDAGLDK